MSAAILVEVDALVKRFRTAGSRGAAFTAIGGVSFRLGAGEALGLVGETGAGKSTIGRCVLGLETPTSGRVALFGQAAARLGGRGWRAVRRNLQAVFQDPKGAIDPRWSVGDLVGEPLRRLTDLSAAAIAERARSSLAAVGLGDEFLGRYRHQLSGGQQQRVNIARAIVAEPRCIVFDEPVAALDTSVKREVVLLLAGLRRQRGLAYLFISHDLRVVRALCDRVAVLFRGRIVEMGPTATVVAAPRHPYTQRLLAAEMALPDEAAGAAALRPEADDSWSLDNPEAAPRAGDLVEVAAGHFVAAQ
jgi:ABC-type glutathione transport system ATPase component